MNKEIAAKVKYWKDLLKRILAMVLFLGERGLNNGHFLGPIQLLAQFNPVLRGHFSEIKQSRTTMTSKPIIPRRILKRL